MSASTGYTDKTLPLLPLGSDPRCTRRDHIHRRVQDTALPHTASCTPVAHSSHLPYWWQGWSGQVHALAEVLVRVGPARTDQPSALP